MISSIAGLPHALGSSQDAIELIIRSTLTGYKTGPDIGVRYKEQMNF